MRSRPGHPGQTVGASHGDALLAVAVIGLVTLDAGWTKIIATGQPNRGWSASTTPACTVPRPLYRYTATRPLISPLRRQENLQADRAGGLAYQRTSEPG